MGVVSVNVGPKRVWLTAYCPDDALGVAACEFLLGRVSELLGDTPDGEFRRWLIERDEGWAEALRLLDAGFDIDRTEALPVSPGNVKAEMRIIEAIRGELAAQRRMG